MINIPFVTICILNIILFIGGKFKSRDIELILIFLFWIILTVLFRHSPNTYIFSFIVTSLLLIPLGISVSWLKINKEKLLKYLVLGCIASMILVPFELFLSYTHLFNYDGFETQVNYEGSTTLLYRVASTMQEPSHYLILLSLIYIIVDISYNKGYKIKYYRIFQFAFLIVLILSISFSGMITIILYFLIKNTKSLVRFFSLGFRPKIKTKTISKAIIFLLLLFVINILSHNIFGKIGYKIVERVNLTTNAVKNKNSEGSSGVRMSFIWVSKYYLESSSALKTLCGEGFSNYSKWLTKNSEKIGYETGLAYNAFLIVLISCGIIGFFIFLLMIINLVNVNSFFECILFLGPFIISLFAHGYLIMYWAWSPVLFYRLIMNSHDSLLVDN